MFISFDFFHRWVSAEKKNPITIINGDRKEKKNPSSVTPPHFSLSPTSLTESNWSFRFSDSGLNRVNVALFRYQTLVVALSSVFLAKADLCGWQRPLCSLRTVIVHSNKLTTVRPAGPLSNLCGKKGRKMASPAWQAVACRPPHGFGRPRQADAMEKLLRFSPIVFTHICNIYICMYNVCINIWDHVVNRINLFPRSVDLATRTSRDSHGLKWLLVVIRVVYKISSFVTERRRGTGGGGGKWESEQGRISSVRRLNLSMPFRDAMSVTLMRSQMDFWSQFHFIFTNILETNLSDESLYRVRDLNCFHRKLPRF